MQDKNGTPIRGGDRVRVTLSFEARVFDWMGLREAFVDAIHPEAPIQVIAAPRMGFFPITVSSSDVEKVE